MVSAYKSESKCCLEFSNFQINFFRDISGAVIANHKLREKGKTKIPFSLIPQYYVSGFRFDE